MNSFAEHTWTLVMFNQAITDLTKTYIKYPPRKAQSEAYDGPVTLSNHEKFQWVREELGKEGVNLPLPSGNWDINNLSQRERSIRAAPSYVSK